MDYTCLHKASAEPKASSMIETFRAIGYNIETAVADIIDNSISANAKNIYINRIWKGGQSVISIMDDGCGMDNDELIQAMRPGSQNPLASRTETDLGRFGLGLKTASFSQCRKLTVVSRKAKEETTLWTWDLDFVAKCDKWELIRWAPDEYLEDFNKLKTGTIVIWSDLDRIINPSTSETDENAKRKFSRDLDRVKQHVAMTFHRFIEDKSITIYWCGEPIEPWNPFCMDESKTQEQPTDFIADGVKVKGYVLPHKNNFSTEFSYKAAEGMNGWNAHQGFYVYRGKRLILAGDWLGMFRKEEHYKLVRIQVDLPNTLDSEWQIDIKKSQASPPINCRAQLLSYAKSVRNKGEEVYRHRGKILRQRAGQSFQPLWLDKKKDDKWYFVINRKNEVIQQIKRDAQVNPSQAIETLLRLVEESIPTKNIYIKEAQGEETQKQPFSGFEVENIRGIVAQMYSNYLVDGHAPEKAKALLKSIEPFNLYEDLIDEL